jgi:peroxiredoxin
VRTIYDEIQRLGGEVLVVTMASPLQLADFTRELGLPFLIVADADRKGYEAFTLGRTNLRSFARVGVIWHFLRLILHGWLPKKPTANSDIWQLGGDFVLDRQARLVFAHPSQDAADRPTPPALLAELRRIA